MRFFFTLCTVFTFVTASAQPTLLKDITDESTLPNNSAIFTPFGVKFNGRYYFVAQSTENGLEVFSTDGIDAGVLLHEVVPGEKGIGTQVSFGATDEFLLFGFLGEDGGQLWSSDGTDSGTKKISSTMAPFVSGSYMFELNGVLYFIGIDDQHGRELWRSDGTVEGTFIVKDIWAGTTSGAGDILTTTSDYVFFTAADGVHGMEVWRTDGTADGTTLVKDLNPGNNLGFYTFAAAYNDKAYFIFDNDIWKTDGTEEGTVAVTDFEQFETTLREELVVVNDKLLFHHSTDTKGMEMYALDLATEQAQLLKDINPGSSDSWDSNFKIRPILVNDAAWFFADLNYGAYSIWKTDGTPENTTKVINLNNYTFGSEYPKALIAAGNVVFFSYGYYLKSIFGEAAVVTINNASVEVVTELNGKLIFEQGELWSSDGTVGGTKALTSINKSKFNYGRWFIKKDGGFNYVSYDFRNNSQVVDLWNSDGTSSGTNMVQSFSPYGFLGDVAVKGNKVFFEASSGSSGSIWTTDGTAAGTKLLKDGNWYNPYGYGKMKQVGNTTYIFDASRNLWKSDGTSAGTVKVKTLPMSYNGNQTVSIGNTLYFLLRHQLWKSDGTDAGTVLVKAFNSTSSSNAQNMVGGTNKFYFIEHDENEEWQIWVSDGTAEGTHIVKDLSADIGYLPYLMTVVDDVAYFNPEYLDGELWRTDGTEEGTYLIKDIYEGWKGSSPNIIATSGSTIYFTANDGVHGYEFWKTDGTEEGTKMIKDIYPGKFSSIWSNTCAAQVIDGILYFSAIDQTHGYELWKTDGTAEGTTLVADVNPGLPSGVSAGTGSMLANGDQLIFLGNDGVHGYEIWEYHTEGTPDPEDPENPEDPGTVLGLEENSGITLWPNPATNSIILNASSFKTAAIKDVLDRDVININITGEETFIDVSHLPRGMYFVKLKSVDQSVITRKVILK